MTRTSSCFLQPRLKVNLSGGGALQHPVLCIQCASETHTLAQTRSPSLSLALSLCLSLFQSQHTIEGDTDAQELFSSSVFSPVLLLVSLASPTLSPLLLLRELLIFQHPASSRASLLLFVRRRSSGCPPLHLKGTQRL